MAKNHFKESDKKNLIEFLNLVAEKSTFKDMKVTDIITFYGLLSYMQKELIPKIQDNIFEIGKVVEQTPPPLPEKKDE